ncbi:hypothetical protein OHB44_17350 [Micromonospora sp. NBC_00821]|nr:hypothetical protein OHB44_17350 [Micromonospora sp. NBC_00821]
MTQTSFMSGVPAQPRTYTVIDTAGHHLAHEQPTLLRSLTQDWPRRTRT